MPTSNGICNSPSFFNRFQFHFVFDEALLFEQLEELAVVEAHRNHEHRAKTLLEEILEHTQ